MLLSSSLHLQLMTRMLPGSYPFEASIRSKDFESGLTTEPLVPAVIGYRLIGMWKIGHTSVSTASTSLSVIVHFLPLALDLALAFLSMYSASLKLFHHAIFPTLLQGVHIHWECLIRYSVMLSSVKSHLHLVHFRPVMPDLGFGGDGNSEVVVLSCKFSWTYQGCS